MAERDEARVRTLVLSRDSGSGCGRREHEVSLARVIRRIVVAQRVRRQREVASTRA